MSIVSELITIIDDVKSRVDEHLQRGKNSAMVFDEKEATRYFTRPIASVAREAKRSIIEFPLIVSEGISGDIASALAKTNQTNAAEYTRLMIANQDIIDVRDEQDLSNVKNTVLAKMRGGSLEETVVHNKTFTEQVSRYVKQNMSKLVEDINSAENVVHPTPLYESALTNFDILTEGMYEVDFGAPKVPSTPEEQKFFEAIEKVGNDLFDGVKAGDIDKINNMMQTVPPEIKHYYETDDFNNKDDHGNKIHWSGYITKVQGNRFKDTYADPLKRSTLRLNKELLSPYITDSTTNAMRSAPEAIMLATMAQNAKKKGKDPKDSTGKLSKQLDTLAKSMNGDREKSALEILAMRAQAANTVNAKDSFARQMKDITVQPTTLELGINLAISPSEVVKTTITMGVASKVHRIPSQDIVINIGESFNRGSLLFNFLRVTSGETSFVKDFVLALDDIRDRHTSNSKGTKLFNKLRRQVEWNKQAQNVVSRAIKDRHYVPPTATLVVTNDEVDRIKDLYNINLHSPSNVRKFMNMTNMMGFTIVDEAMGSVAFFEDGDNDFNIIAISELTRQSGKDTGVKDILSIMAKR